MCMVSHRHPAFYRTIFDDITYLSAKLDTYCIFGNKFVKVSIKLYKISLNFANCIDEVESKYLATTKI